jgi:hypothetical protein
MNEATFENSILRNRLSNRSLVILDGVKMLNRLSN